MMVHQATLKDLDQLITLIQCTTKHHIEKHVYQWQHPCETKALQEEIQKGEVYIITSDDHLVGSYSIRKSDDEYPVKIQNSAYLYRLMVHPFYQEQDVMAFIFKYVKKHHNKRQTVLVDCWAGNEKLFELYRRHDCDFIGDFPALDYKISVFQIGKGKDDE